MGQKTKELVERFNALNNELNDEDLDKAARFSLAGGDINTKQLIKIIIHGANEHLTNIKATIS